MPRRIYPLRILGMGLGGMVVGVVLWERHASVSAWLAMVLPAFVWPHVAYLITRHSADPYRAETRNLLIDSALAASFVPLMHFNLLPSVLLLTLTMVDKITTGIRGLWARALPAMLVGGLAGVALAGLHWAPETSMRVMVACLPVMALHTLSVSMVSYQLIRQSARHNQMLDELRRVDALTGLFGRGHWQEQAEAALRRHHASNEPACMLMLDIDHFKEINDTHGHQVGDMVLKELAGLVQTSLRGSDVVARYGGEEFAIILPETELDGAVAAAEKIRKNVARNPFPGADASLQIRVSLGVANWPRHKVTHIDQLIRVADDALYIAKESGRDKVVVAQA